MFTLNSSKIIVVSFIHYYFSIERVFIVVSFVIVPNRYVTGDDRV